MLPIYPEATTHLLQEARDHEQRVAEARRITALQRVEEARSTTARVEAFLQAPPAPPEVETVGHAADAVVDGQGFPYDDDLELPADMPLGASGASLDATPASAIFQLRRF